MENFIKIKTTETGQENCLNTRFIREINLVDIAFSYIPIKRIILELTTYKLKISLDEELLLEKYGLMTLSEYCKTNTGKPYALYVQGELKSKPDFFDFIKWHNKTVCDYYKQLCQCQDIELEDIIRASVLD